MEAAAASVLRKMDIKIMLELGDPGLLAFTLTEQKVVTADPGGHKLFKDVSAQDESDTVGGVTGIKPFLQKKDGLTDAESRTERRRSYR